VHHAGGKLHDYGRHRLDARLLGQRRVRLAADRAIAVSLVAQHALQVGDAELRGHRADEGARAFQARDRAEAGRERRLARLRGGGEKVVRVAERPALRRHDVEPRGRELERRGVAGGVRAQDVRRAAEGQLRRKRNRVLHAAPLEQRAQQHVHRHARLLAVVLRAQDVQAHAEPAIVEADLREHPGFGQR